MSITQFPGLTFILGWVVVLFVEMGEECCSNLSSGVKFFVISFPSFLWSPSDIHPTGEHCLKLDVSSRSLGLGSFLLPDPHPRS